MEGVSHVNKTFAAAWPHMITTYRPYVLQSDIPTEMNADMDECQAGTRLAADSFDAPGTSDLIQHILATEGDAHALQILHDERAAKRFDKPLTYSQALACMSHLGDSISSAKSIGPATFVKRDTSSHVIWAWPYEYAAYALNLRWTRPCDCRWSSFHDGSPRFRHLLQCS